jgi:tight adherence protein B
MTLTAAKRMEATILSIAPAFFLIALSLLSPGYIQPMYETVLGKFLLGVGFILLIANYIIGKRIIKIDI